MSATLLLSSNLYIAPHDLGFVVETVTAFVHGLVTDFEFPCHSLSCRAESVKKVLGGPEVSGGVGLGIFLI